MSLLDREVEKVLKPIKVFKLRNHLFQNKCSTIYKFLIAVRKLGLITPKQLDESRDRINEYLARIPQ